MHFFAFVRAAGLDLHQPAFLRFGRSPLRPARNASGCCDPLLDTASRPRAERKRRDRTESRHHRRRRCRHCRRAGAASCASALPAARSAAAARRPGLDHSHARSRLSDRPWLRLAAFGRPQSVGADCRTGQCHDRQDPAAMDEAVDADRLSAFAVSTTFARRSMPSTTG